MRLVVERTRYVGLVSAACFTDSGRLNQTQIMYAGRRTAELIRKLFRAGPGGGAI